MTKILILALSIFVVNVHSQSSAPSKISKIIKENIVISDTVSVSDTALGVDLIGGTKKGTTVYPNPANNHIIVSMPSLSKENREIRLVNEMGQPILQLKNLHEYTYVLDVSTLRSGIYIIEVISGSGVTRTRWVKN